MKKMTVVVDEKLLERAAELSGLKTQREVIEAALKDFIIRRNMLLLKEEMGTYDLDLTPEDLKKMRRDRQF